jgi:ribosomal protein S5
MPRSSSAISSVTAETMLIAIDLMSGRSVASGVHVRVTGTLVEVGSAFCGHGIRTSRTPLL